MRNISILLQFAIIVIFTTYSTKVNAQQYIAKCQISTDYDPDGICASSRSFKDPEIVSPIAYYNSTSFSWKGTNVLWQKSGSYRTSETAYVKVNNGNNLSLVFIPTDYERAFGRALNFSINGAKSYDKISHSDKKLVGACLYKGSISFSVITYDVPKATSVTFPNCSNCTGNTVCVGNVNDKIQINYFSVNNGSYNFINLIKGGYTTLEVRRADNNSLIKEIDLGYLPNGIGNRQFTISELSLQNYYGIDVYFRFKLSMGGQTIYSDSSDIFTLFKQIPAPTISTHRQACYPYLKIDVTLDNSVVNDINRYKFRAIYGDCETGECHDSTSGIIRLIQYGSPNGNVVTFRPHPSDRHLMKNAGLYTMQIFQDIQEASGDKTVSFQDISCAVKKRFYVDSLIQTPSFTITPLIIGDTKYHVTRHDKSDGQIQLAIDNIDQTTSRISAYVGKAEPDEPDAFTGATVQSVKTWDKIELDGIYGKSIYLRKSEWIIDSLEGNARYFIYLEDDDGCKTSKRYVDLFKPDSITFAVDNTRKVACHINNVSDTIGVRDDGELSFQFSGGIPPYSVILDGETVLTNLLTTNASIDSLLEKSYTIQVKDAYGEYSAEVKDSVHSNPEIILSAIPSDVACYNDGSGAIELQVSNNTVPGGVSFGLNGNTTPFISDTSYTYSYLEPGEYSAQVVNKKGCKATLPDISIHQPKPIETEISAYKIRRYGGNTGVILFEIQGGTARYYYSLYHGDTLIDSYPTSDYGVAIELYAGYYRLEVEDANGCEYTEDDIYVQQPEAPLELSFVRPSLPVDCYGAATGEVYPIATGGWGEYRYGINNSIVGSDNIITGLRASGDVPDTVFVRTKYGVIEKLPVTITQPSPVRSSIDSVYDLWCFEDSSGAVRMNISGGTPGYSVSADSINWFSGDSLSRLSAGAEQIVYIKDAHNCVETERVTITQPEKVKIAVDTVIDAFCGQHNGAISTSVTGGSEVYSYQWNYVDSLQSFSIDSHAINTIYSGEYQLHVADENACTDSIMVLVSDEDGPEITGYRIDSVSCFGNSDGKLSIVQINGGMPGYTYYLDGKEEGPIYADLVPDTYHVRVVDAKGCKFDTVYTVSQPDKLVLSGTVSQPLCHDSFDGTITTRVSGGNGGYTYDWSHGEETADVYDLNSGRYGVRVYDRKNCMVSDSFDIVPPAQLSAHLDAYYPVLCTGNSMELDGGEFAGYQWFQNNVPVSRERYLTVDETGEYVLMIHNERGCVGLDTFNLEVSDTPLDAHILLQDSALVNESVEAIDVTWPVPDSVQWYFDYPVERLEANSWSQQFAGDTASTISVTLRAWYGGCFSDSSKTVTIYYADDSVMKKAAHKEPLILGCKVYPNPNYGDFYVGVELSTPRDVVIQVFHGGTSDAITGKRQSGLSSYEIPFNFSGVPAGVYIIVVSAGQEQQQLKVVVR